MSLTGGGFDGSCSLIPLDCVEGQHLLEESDHTTLVHHYCKQENLTYCALRSVAICLNGMFEVSQGKGQQLIPQDSHLSRLLRMKVEAGPIGEEDVLVVGGAEADLDMEDLKLNGMILPTFGKLCGALGLKSFVFHVITETSSISDTSIRSVKTLDEFRSTVLDSLRKKGHFVAVNYLMSFLGFVSLPFGHFSPIGGYHPKQDRFLVLDVWPDTPAVWVKSEDLFNSMKDFDSSSGLPRGFCVLGIP